MNKEQAEIIAALENGNEGVVAESSGSTVLSLRMSRSLLDGLGEQAERENTAVSTLARRVLTEYLAAAPPAQDLRVVHVARVVRRLDDVRRAASLSVAACGG